MPEFDQSIFLKVQSTLFSFYRKLSLNYNACIFAQKILHNRTDPYQQNLTFVEIPLIWNSKDPDNNTTIKTKTVRLWSLTWCERLRLETNTKVETVHLRTEKNVKGKRVTGIIKVIGWNCAVEGIHSVVLCCLGWSAGSNRTLSQCCL